MTAMEVAIYLMKVMESRTTNNQVQIVSVALQNPTKLITMYDHILRNRLLMRSSSKNITRRGKGPKKIAGS